MGETFFHGSFRKFLLYHDMIFRKLVMHSTIIKVYKMNLSQ